MAEKTFEESVQDGQAVYNKRVLIVYDLVVTHYSNRFIWRCPASHIKQWYKQYIGQKHLDIGVGSGYYLQRCTQKVQELHLMDLNQTALQYAKNRSQHGNCATTQHNIFEPLPATCNGYDSVAINYLLHCIPGTFANEKAKAISNAVATLKKGGRLFGATIINADEQSSGLAHKLMQIYNKKAIFHNQNDTQEQLHQALKQQLKQVQVQRIGSVILFSGQKQ